MPRTQNHRNDPTSIEFSLNKRENRGRTPRLYYSIFADGCKGRAYAPRYAFLIWSLASSSLPVPLMTTLPVSST